MTFSGMICHHPRTNQLDFGSDQVKGQGQGQEGLKNYWTELHEIFRDDLSSSKDKSIRFCGSDQVKGQGQGHKKVKNLFLSKHAQFSSDSYETNTKMFTFQFPIL